TGLLQNTSLEKVSLDLNMASPVKISKEINVIYPLFSSIMLKGYKNITLSNWGLIPEILVDILPGIRSSQLQGLSIQNCAIKSEPLLKIVQNLPLSITQLEVS